MDLNSKLLDLIRNTEYSITQVNGQRIYGLRDQSIELPPNNTELFIGRLPRDLCEDELVPLFAAIGPIYQLRMMVDFTDKNRGYCFVQYFKREHAELAIRKLNRYEIRPQCRLGVYWSLNNTRLFIGGIPKNKTKYEIEIMLHEVMNDIQDIIMYPSHDSHLINRGYVFVEFNNHKSAAIARRQLPPGTILWNVKIKVDWADPVPVPPTDIMAKVSTLYVRNVPIEMSQYDVERQLNKVTKPHRVLKVYKSLDYAFVHYATPVIAEECKKILQNGYMCGQNIQVTWARPQEYSTRISKYSTPDHYCMSLPARSRWLIKKKRRSFIVPEDTSPRARLDSPLFKLPRDLDIIEEYLRDMAVCSTSSDDQHIYI